MWGLLTVHGSAPNKSEHDRAFCFVQLCARRHHPARRMGFRGWRLHAARGHAATLQIRKAPRGARAASTTRGSGGVVPASPLQSANRRRWCHSAPAALGVCTAPKLASTSAVLPSAPTSVTARCRRRSSPAGQGDRGGYRNTASVEFCRNGKPRRYSRRGIRPTQ